MLLQRAQSLAMWMIEAASYIDLDDARWSCIMLYEKTQPWGPSSPSHVSCLVLPSLLRAPLVMLRAPWSPCARKPPWPRLLRASCDAAIGDAAIGDAAVCLSVYHAMHFA